MVGGGSDAFIGAIHRRAAFMDNQIELVCGCFSVDPEISKSSGLSYFLPEDRIYSTYQEMFEHEMTLPEGERMDFVTIDLLKGNAEIAAQFGKDIRQYCPDVKHVVVVFNPADITGLITLLYSGLKPSQVSTLAALDSTRLQNELAKFFKIPASKIQNCRTYGGHGEQMAVFASTTTVDGDTLINWIGTTRLPQTEWDAIKQRVIQGGKHIIDLRGRSSFQSPAYLSIEMIAAAMGGAPFRWPAGTYVSDGKFNHIMMAMETSITKNGISYKQVEGTPIEEEELENSYKHLCKLRDEVIEMGIIPAIEDWHTLNPNIK